MNNYHIYEEIGRGRFSVVYKGRKKKSIEYVAVKSLEKTRRKKVLNEVRIFHNLTHPNILKFYNWYETRNHLWIIFEYCSGGDLLQLIEQDKALPENVTKFFSRDLMLGLQYLHSNGIIYCDLKPSNVLLNEFGSLKLCDFGLARKIVDLIQPDNNASDATNISKKGTPYYMAPELFQDDGVHSYTSDLWSLGCVLYELATGHPPFVSASFTELVNLILNAETPRVEKFSTAFNDLLAGLLQKDPVKRISWENLRDHPFWSPFDVAALSIPPQPHFENFLKARGILEKQSQPVSAGLSKDEKPSGVGSAQQSAADKAKNLGGSSSANQLPKKITTNPANFKSNTHLNDLPADNKKNVNIVRLSHNVMKNIIRESMNLYQEQINENDQDKNDIKLDRDQEIDLGEGEDDEEDLESESKENDSTPYTSANEDNSAMNSNSEEEYSTDQHSQLGKMEFNTQKNDKKTLSNKPYPTTKQNARNLKPEVDEMNITMKNSRSNLSSRGGDGDKSPASANTPLSHQRSNSANSTGQQSQAKAKLMPIEQLLQHNSDTSVKPITGNKEIEKPQELSFNKDALSFPALTLEEVVEGIDTPQIENHLADIYNFLAGNAHMNDKIQALNYFETIILNSAVANRLVNSAFMNLLLKLLKNIKTAPAKMKLCSIVGQLIRHATVIENELSQLGIPTVLTEVMRDKSEKVKRKAIAALGEYLFYGATQMDEENGNVNVWEISTSTIALLARILKSPTEEETVKFYAAKTIENITAQSVSAGAKFANQEMLLLFISVYSTTKNEHLKVCAAVTLNHLSRLNNPLSILVVEKLTMKHIAQVFMESNPRIQQAFITILNLFIQTAGNKSTPVLNEEKSFFSSLMGLLEHSSIVIRGKCLLTFCLLFKVNLKWLAILQENKFVTFIDRLSRDNYKYIQCCLAHLVEAIMEIIPMILKNILDELTKLKAQNNGGNMIADSPALKESNKSFLNFLPIIISSLNSQTIKYRFMTPDFLMTIITIFDEIENMKNPKIDEYRSLIFMIFELFTSNPKPLLSLETPVLTTLFPSLLNKLTSDNPDTRFNSLKIFTDILIIYLNEDSVYDVGCTKNSAKMINDTISSKLLPSAKHILSDQEPMPQYGLKLFSILLERNIEFVDKIRKLRTLNLFLDNFQLSHPRLTSHTVKLVARLAEYKETTFEDLQGPEFVSRLVNIFQDQFANQQEWGYEDLLDVTYYTLEKIVDSLISEGVPIDSVDNLTSPVFIADDDAREILESTIQITELIDILVSLLPQFEPSSGERCASCILSILYLYGYFGKSNVSLQSEHTALLISTLNTHNTPSVTKKILKVLQWTSAIQDNRLFVPNEKRNQLISTLEKARNSDDKQVTFLIKEILKCI